MAKFQVLLKSLDRVALFDFLRIEVGATLAALPGVTLLQLNLVDDDVKAAAKRCIGDIDYQALCSVGVDDEHRAPRDAWPAIKAVFETGADVVHGYDVEEAEPLANAQRLSSGERTPGFCQLAFLRRPDAMAYEDWLTYWKTEHTGIAIATQATFRYVQNRVLAVLSDGAPGFEAIVEECFPAAAMDSDEAFYDAVGNLEVCQKRQQQMLDSCAKFIDFNTIAVLPSSEYRLS